jgi:hypothetical protein
MHQIPHIHIKIQLNQSNLQILDSHIPYEGFLVDIAYEIEIRPIKVRETSCVAL